MSSEILKTVDWIIDVPDVGVNQVFSTRTFSSTIFNVKFKNLTTLWKLHYCLNHGSNDKLYVYLELCSDPKDVEFDCRVVSSVLNSSFTKSCNLCKSKWTQVNQARGYCLTASKVLREKRNELCPNGKLFLTVTIQAIDQKVLEVANESPIDCLENVLGIDMFISPHTNDLIDINTDDGTVLKAHKNLLSLKSVVFQTMFTIGLKETWSNSVDVIEFDGPVMRELLRFIYYGKVQNIEQINVELFKAAKVYEIGKLPEICLLSIIATVNQENVIERVLFADVYELEELFQQCCSVIKELRQNQNEMPSEIKTLNEALLLKILDTTILKTSYHLHDMVEYSALNFETHSFSFF